MYRTQFLLLLHSQRGPLSLAPGSYWPIFAFDSIFHPGFFRKRVSRKSGAGGGSDNESDVSGVSWNGGGHHGVRRNRNESGSESEHGTARRQHRGRRKR